MKLFKYLSPMQILVNISVGFMILCNVLLLLLPVGSQISATVDGKFPTYFSPISYTFFIWVLIYMTLGFGIMTWSSLSKNRNNVALSRMRPWIVLSAASNIVAAFLWYTGHFTLAFIPMAILLVSLVVLYWSSVRYEQFEEESFRWQIKLPVSLYLGWIAVATAHHAALLLAIRQYNSLGITPINFTIVALLFIGLIAFLLIVLKRDVIFAAAATWAFVGVYIKFGDISQISTLAVLEAIVLLFAIIASLFLFQPPEHPELKSESAKIEELDTNEKSTKPKRAKTKSR